MKLDAKEKEYTRSNVSLIEEERIYLQKSKLTASALACFPIASILIFSDSSLLAFKIASLASSSAATVDLYPDSSSRIFCGRTKHKLN